MSPPRFLSGVKRFRDHFLPPDRAAFRAAASDRGRVIVIAPTRAACETIELALGLHLSTLLEREHGEEVRSLARADRGFGIVAGTGTGKTLSIRPIAEEILREPLRTGVVNREREATKETPTWNVVIVTTGIARRWFQDDLIRAQDTIVVDEIHQTSAELELCLALGKRVGCRFIWLSATVDPQFYAEYLGSADVLETRAFDPSRAARIRVSASKPLEYLDDRFLRRVVRESRGVAVFVPTRAEVEELASDIGGRWGQVTTAFYHGGEPIRVIRPFLDGEVKRPFLLAMTAAGQSALNVPGLDTVIILDARYVNRIDGGRNILVRTHLGPNEILQMAGRVHGRVAGGEVHILSDRKLDFAALHPDTPEFQLAGDVERVALTCAALGVDAATLDLPVEIDREAYRRAVSTLRTRGIIDDRHRLTDYGSDVEAMPVDRPWAELLVHAPQALVPFVSVTANVDSLFRMTRQERDLRGLVVPGSDHLTAYNVYADAYRCCGTLGRVHGLPRHVFDDEALDSWGQERGVLVKSIEDIALAMASVYRTLEHPLPESMPRASAKTLGAFADLLARTMPLDLVIDEETADGRPVKVARNSVCKPWSGVAGRIRYFADRHGRQRAAIEGTNISYENMAKYAQPGRPLVTVEHRKRRIRLVVRRSSEYYGFRSAEEVRPLPEPFPGDLADSARRALVDAALAGQSGHPDDAQLALANQQLDTYWCRSGGALVKASPEHRVHHLGDVVRSVTSYDGFLKTSLTLPVEEWVSGAEREALDRLPASITLLGDRIPIVYDIDGGVPVARIRVREGRARRLRTKHLPRLDRPLRIDVVRGHRRLFTATDSADLMSKLAQVRRSGRARR